METAYPTRQDRVPRSPGPRTPVARSCPKQSTHLTMGSQRVELPPPPEPVLVSTWRASSSARHCSVTARLCKQGAGQWERTAPPPRPRHTEHGQKTPRAAGPGRHAVDIHRSGPVRGERCRAYRPNILNITDIPPEHTEHTVRIPSKPPHGQTYLSTGIIGSEQQTRPSRQRCDNGSAGSCQHMTAAVWSCQHLVPGSRSVGPEFSTTASL